MGAISLLFLGLAPFDIGSYSLNNDLITGPAFLRRIGILWGAQAVTSLGIAYALWRELTWSRIAILIWWLVITVMFALAALQDGHSVVTGVLSGLGGAGLAAWYLYGRPGVRAYFRLLQSRPGLV